jgi:ribosomal protein S18 acetylase RimI-like enzyme
MITLTMKDGVGSIDLLAVLEGCRGQGLAHALGAAGHVWMRQNGATRSRVVTQLENSAACRFYRRVGYDLETVKDYYHFWVGGL